MQVAYWFTLHSCIFLKTSECDKGFKHPHFGEVLIQCIETLCDMPQFDVDIDLTRVPIIISVVCKVREFFLTISKNKKSYESLKLLKSFEDNGVLFLLMIM